MNTQGTKCEERCHFKKPLKIQQIFFFFTIHNRTISSVDTQTLCSLDTQSKAWLRVKNKISLHQLLKKLQHPLKSCFLFHNGWLIHISPIFFTRKDDMKKNKITTKPVSMWLPKYVVSRLRIINSSISMSHATLCHVSMHEFTYEEKWFNVKTMKWDVFSINSF